MPPSTTPYRVTDVSACATPAKPTIRAAASNVFFMCEISMDFFESFRAAQSVPLLYLTPKKEVKVIAPKFRADDYVYTAFSPKKSCFCLIHATKRGFLGTKAAFETLDCKSRFTFFDALCFLLLMRLIFKFLYH